MNFIFYAFKRQKAVFMVSHYVKKYNTPCPHFERLVFKIKLTTSVYRNKQIPCKII